MNFKRFFFFSIILLVFVSIKGQQNSINGLVKRCSFYQAGIQLGLPFQNELLPEGKYIPILLQTNFDFNLRRKKTLTQTKNKFFFYLEPYFTPVVIKNLTPSYEVGINIGFKYAFYFNSRSTIKLNIGSGPQFQAFNSKRQVSGYIFSDNVGLSYQYNFSNNPLFLNIGYRFRHISNLDIKLPNKGIDTHFIIIGLGWNRL